MLGNLPSQQGTDFRLVLPAYKEAMQTYHDGAVIAVAKRYLLGEDNRKDKRFAPSLAEFTQAVKRENVNWDGMRKLGYEEMRSRAIGDHKPVQHVADPDLETKHEKWRRDGREVIERWRSKGLDPSKEFAASLKTPEDEEKRR
jgi:hypothetical protein